jgi:hypothetical protein
MPPLSPFVPRACRSSLLSSCLAPRVLGCWCFLAPPVVSGVPAVSVFQLPAARSVLRSSFVHAQQCALALPSLPSSVWCGKKRQERRERQAVSGKAGKAQAQAQAQAQASSQQARGQRPAVPVAVPEPAASMRQSQPEPGEGEARQASGPAGSVARGPEGLSSISWGARWTPPPVRKCHQMSSKEHIQLGWVVRWALSTPPGHPTAGRCGRVVPVLPLLLCTRPARARPSVGGQSPPPAPR